MLEIVPLSALQDNYIWTLRDGKYAAVVDPGDARPVKEYLAREGLELVAIMATHHQPDHVGGISELVAMKKVPVFGPKGEPIPELTHPVGQGDKVEIPSLKSESTAQVPSFDVLDIPGHTRAHVAYYGLESLFSGDTLFACGCGRLFEGTAQQMMASLSKLAALPDATKIYCGHEYTLANIKFAQAVEPANAALAARLERDRRLRDAGKPTLPSTLGEERATNPFLRWREPAVIESANKYLGARVSDPLRVFSAIREWKNGF